MLILISNVVCQVNTDAFHDLTTNLEVMNKPDKNTEMQETIKCYKVF